MKVFMIKHSTLGGGWVTWSNAADAIDEVISHIEESEIGDHVEIKIAEMTKEDFEKLPEFKGY